MLQVTFFCNNFTIISFDELTFFLLLYTEVNLEIAIDFNIDVTKKKKNQKKKQKFQKLNLILAKFARFQSDSE